MSKANSNMHVQPNEHGRTYGIAGFRVWDGGYAETPQWPVVPQHLRAGSVREEDETADVLDKIDATLAASPPSPPNHRPEHSDDNTGADKPGNPTGAERPAPEDTTATIVTLAQGALFFADLPEAA